MAKKAFHKLGFALETITVRYFSRAFKLNNDGLELMTEEELKERVNYLNNRLYQFINQGKALVRIEKRIKIALRLIPSVVIHLQQLKEECERELETRRSTNKKKSNRILTNVNGK